ncbi:hypothetical protein AB5I41_10020 [Sphingomonas sp. MMS24-JH45]
MLAPALLAVAAAMLLVRYGWERRRAISVGGWALAIAALGWLGWQAGAWGAAMGTVAGMVCAIGVVLHAGWRSPRRRRPGRHARRRRSRSPIARVVWTCAGWRSSHWTVPVAFVAAQGLAFAVQEVARARGTGAADAIVLMLFLQPVLWAGIVAIQMTRAGPVQMILPPMVAALTGGVLWSIA